MADAPRAGRWLMAELGGCHGVDSLICPGRAVSWEQGEDLVCEIPICVTGVLSLMICRLNGRPCSHRPAGPRCADCFRRLMALERRLVGTRAFDDGFAPAERRRVLESLARLLLTSKSSTELRPAGRRRLARQEWHGATDIVMDLAVDLQVQPGYEQDLLLAGVVIDRFLQVTGLPV